MDLKQVLLKEHATSATNKITRYIGDDPKRFGYLMNLLHDENSRVCQRAAFTMSEIVHAHPSLLEPYIAQLIRNLSEASTPIKRNTVRALQFIAIPAQYQGIAVDQCFKLLNGPKEAIAVKVFAMSVISNICDVQPSIARELKISIESQLPQASAGFRSRGNKILAKLSR